MDDTFDELAKSLAQSATRRGALKQFGLGLAGIALASLGLANQALAQPSSQRREPGPRTQSFHCHCNKPDYGCARYADFGACTLYCSSVCSPF